MTEGKSPRGEENRNLALSSYLRYQYSYIVVEVIVVSRMIVVWASVWNACYDFVEQRRYNEVAGGDQQLPGSCTKGLDLKKY